MASSLKMYGEKYAWFAGTKVTLFQHKSLQTERRTEIIIEIKYTIPLTESE